MQTKDLVIYGALIYLFFMLRKKTTCNCAATLPVLPLDKVLVDFAPRDRSVPILPILPVADCVNCNFSNMDNSNLLNFPTFTKVNTQVQPTPATVLSPEQLAVYNATIKGFSNKYIC
jgi:hypothetical protein